MRYFGRNDNKMDSVDLGRDDRNNGGAGASLPKRGQSFGPFDKAQGRLIQDGIGKVLIIKRESVCRQFNQ